MSVNLDRYVVRFGAGTAALVRGRDTALLFTAAHLAPSDTRTRVDLPQGGTVDAVVLQIDEDVDLAIYELSTVTPDAGLPIAPLEVVRSGAELECRGYGTNDEKLTTKWTARGKYLGPGDGSAVMLLEALQVKGGASGGPWFSAEDGCIVGIQSKATTASTGRFVGSVIAARADAFLACEQVASRLSAFAGGGPAGRAVRSSCVGYHIGDSPFRVQLEDGGSLRNHRPRVPEIAQKSVQTENVVLADSGDCLLYGPPEVGKTTRAIAEAIDHERQQGASDCAFYFDTKFDDAERLDRVLDRLSHQIQAGRSMLFVFDDIHFSVGEKTLGDWVRCVDNLPSSCRLLWISRSEESGQDLLEARCTRRFTVQPFPADRVPKLFHAVLPDTPWVGALAAFATDLDPAMLQEVETLIDRLGPPDATDSASLEAFSDAIARAAAESSLRWWLSAKQELGADVAGRAAANLLAHLLPVATLDRDVPLDFLRRFVPEAHHVATTLEQRGLAATRTITRLASIEEPGVDGYRAERTIRASVHAFQADRVLRRISPSELPNGASAAYSFTDNALPIRASLPSAVLGCLASCARDNQEIQELADRAQWTGVPEHMKAGFEWLDEHWSYIGGDAARRVANLDPHIGKLDRLTRVGRGVRRRSVAQQNETTPLGAADDLLEDMRALCGQSDALEAVGAFVEDEIAPRVHGGEPLQHRLDRLLYEIGYNEYLRSDFGRGGLYMDASMLAFVGSLTSSSQREDWTFDAIGHVWVSVVNSHEYRVYSAIDRALGQGESLTEVERATCRDVAVRLEAIANGLMRAAQATDAEDPGTLGTEIASLISVEAGYGDTDVSGRVSTLWRHVPRRAHKVLRRRLWERAAQCWYYAERIRYEPVLTGVATTLPLDPLWQGASTDDPGGAEAWQVCEAEALRRSRYVVPYGEQLHKLRRYEWAAGKRSNQDLSEALASVELEYVAGVAENMGWKFLLAAQIAHGRGDTATIQTLSWLASRYAGSGGAGMLALRALEQLQMRDERGEA